MKALSIRQPFAERILIGTKKIEYRSVKTNFRGRVYIYSSQKTSYEKDVFSGKKVTQAGIPNFPTGVIVGSVKIVDCVPVQYVAKDKLTGEEYIATEYQWILENPKRLKHPLKPTKKPQPIFFNPF